MIQKLTSLPSLDTFPNAFVFVLDILSSLLQILGARDDLLYGVFGWIDHYADHLKSALNPVVMENSITQTKLDELESITRLFYQLAGLYPCWRRQRSTIARAYTERSLSLTKQLVDVLMHPNRFNAFVTLVADGKTVDTSVEDLSVTKSAKKTILLIIKNVLASVVIFTGSMDVFTTPAFEWDASWAVFIPALEVSPRNIESVSLGTLTNLMVHARDKLNEGDDEPMESLLVTITELSSILFVSQMLYHLFGGQIDLRQKEQLALELGSEISVILESICKIFGKFKSHKKTAELLSTLRKHVEDEIRTS